MPWLLACILLVVFNCPGLADTNLTKLEELKARSLSIRNTDLQLRRKAEWQQLAQALEDWASDNQQQIEAADALFSAGLLWRILFQGTGNDEFAEQAESVFKRIVEKYPDSRQASQSLLKLADMYWNDLEDQDEARTFYRQVVKLYPGTDAALIASEKLNGDSAKSKDSQTATRQRKPNFSGRRAVIVLDPGHGGEDLGAVAGSGLMEKDIVLLVSLELEKLLTERLPVKVVLTRRSDVFVPLAARTQFANDYEADVFISIHINSSPSGKAAGLEVYYLDNTDDQASQTLAERENASLNYEERPNDLQFMMSDMIQSAKLQESIQLASTLNREMISFMSARWEGVRSLGVKKAPFYVLVGAHMPCALVELFFINNAVDGANLIKKDFRHDLAKGLFHAIERYLIETGQFGK